MIDRSIGRVTKLRPRCRSMSLILIKMRHEMEEIEDRTKTTTMAASSGLRRNLTNRHDCMRSGSGEYLGTSGSSCTYTRTGTRLQVSSIADRKFFQAMLGLMDLRDFSPIRIYTSFHSLHESHMEIASARLERGHGMIPSIKRCVH